jgi:hypothetical protein
MIKMELSNKRRCRRVVVEGVDGFFLIFWIRDNIEIGK